MIPKVFHRVTSHKTPRHQLYQPGFNDSNGCWLEGEWVVVPAGEFAARKREHLKLYRGIHKDLSKQSHHGKRVAFKHMTPAQRQAWEYFSGTATLEVRYPNGQVGGIGVKLGGRAVNEASLRWVQERQAKVIPRIIEPNKKVRDQSKMVPPEYLSDDKDPVDVWKLVVKQNKANFREFAKASAELSRPNEPGVPPGVSGVMSGVAVQNLLEMEQQIIRHKTSKGPDLYETLEESTAEYVEHRAEMKQILGENFTSIYAAAKASHNKCARINLDNSEGFLACYVLPEFRDDGTHEPWGPRDIPWGRDDVNAEAKP